MAANALPWLVVHGALIGKLVVVGCALAGPLFLYWLVRAGAARQASRGRAALGAGGHVCRSTERFTDGAVVTLDGRLDSRGDRHRFQDGRSCAAATLQPLVASGAPAEATLEAISVRAEKLRVVLRDTDVSLCGPVEVAVGSHESHANRALHRLDPNIGWRVVGAPHDRDLAAYTHVAPIMRAVERGDRVLVRGVLRARAGIDTSGSPYRKAATRWELHPDANSRASSRVGSEPTGEAMAMVFTGRPRVAVMPRRRYASRAVIGMAAGVVLLAVQGLIALGLAGDAEDMALDGRLSNSDPIALAAVSPVTRHLAMQRIDMWCELEPGQCGHRVEDRVALKLESGQCEQAAEVLLDHGQFERAARRASSCASPQGAHLAGRAYFLAGHFSKASNAFSHARTIREWFNYRGHGRVELVAHILAREWSRAERVAFFYADGDLRVRRRDPATRSALICLGNAFALRSGSRTLSELLDMSEAIPACRLLVAELAVGKIRLDVLEKMVRQWSERRSGVRSGADGDELSRLDTRLDGHPDDERIMLAGLLAIEALADLESHDYDLDQEARDRAVDLVLEIGLTGHGSGSRPLDAATWVITPTLERTIQRLLDVVPVMPEPLVELVDLRSANFDRLFERSDDPAEEARVRRQAEGELLAELGVGDLVHYSHAVDWFESERARTGEVSSEAQEWLRYDSLAPCSASPCSLRAWLWLMRYRQIVAASPAFGELADDPVAAIQTRFRRALDIRYVAVLLSQVP